MFMLRDVNATLRSTEVEGVDTVNESGHFTVDIGDERGQLPRNYVNLSTYVDPQVYMARAKGYESSLTGYLVVEWAIEEGSGCKGCEMYVQ